MSKEVLRCSFVQILLLCWYPYIESLVVGVKGGFDNFVSSHLFNVVASLTETRIGKKGYSII